MAHERSKSFSGIPRFTGMGLPRAGGPHNNTGSGSKGLGKGKGQGLGGGFLKRHRKVVRDNIQGVTKNDIRRLARRGGVKRISAQIYEETRIVLKLRLEQILREVCAIVEYSGRKTVSVRDIVFVLHRLGTPIYGFDPAFLKGGTERQKRP
ncbi:histone-fold-containing protein [Delitschia confertaspora ATCC 74209]|uniref:Histone H4 n=1 Tax=Delitschia confertaspora ATCC 74209 TaxID=1513339 RepID=A0A9P4JQ63_9PLEO|nr:histone-fold-containing protein [Delitschia confertaspora ATCC 74209]